MPKAFLEFTLPEDQNSFEVTVKSMDYAIVWQDLKNRIRELLKYDPTLKPEACLALEEIRKYMAELETDRQLPELL